MVMAVPWAPDTPPSSSRARECRLQPEVRASHRTRWVGDGVPVDTSTRRHSSNDRAFSRQWRMGCRDPTSVASRSRMPAILCTLAARMRKPPASSGPPRLDTGAPGMFQSVVGWILAKAVGAFGGVAPSVVADRVGAENVIRGHLAGPSGPIRGVPGRSGAKLPSSPVDTPAVTGISHKVPSTKVLSGGTLRCGVLERHLTMTCQSFQLVHRRGTRCRHLQVRKSRSVAESDRAFDNEPHSGKSKTPLTPSCIPSNMLRL